MMNDLSNKTPLFFSTHMVQIVALKVTVDCRHSSGFVGQKHTYSKSMTSNVAPTLHRIFDLHQFSESTLPFSLHEILVN